MTSAGAFVRRTPRAPLCSTPRPDGVDPSATIRNEQHTIPRREDAQLALGARTALVFEIEPPLNVTTPPDMATTPPSICAEAGAATRSAIGRRTPSADTRPPDAHPARAARTRASVPDIATVSNSAVPLAMESTPPPKICARAHRAAARQPQQPALRPIEPRARS